MLDKGRCELEAGLAECAPLEPGCSQNRAMRSLETVSAKMDGNAFSGVQDVLLLIISSLL